MRTTYVCSLLLLSVGCYNSADADDAAEASIDDSSNSSPLAGGSSSETDLDEIWWRLSADIELLDGDPIAVESTLYVTLQDGDGAALCEVEAALTTSDTEEVPDPLLLTWWTLSPDDWTGTCIDGGEDVTPITPPELDPVQIGFGELHSEIRAVLESSDAGGAVETLNGAYASIDGAEIVVYGVAGTAGAYAGEEGPADVTPLADGTWSVAALYAFRYTR